MTKQKLYPKTKLKREQIEHYRNKKCDYTCPHISQAVKDSYTLWTFFWDSNGNFIEDKKYEEVDTICSREIAEREKYKSTYMCTERVEKDEDGTFTYRKWIDDEKLKSICFSLAKHELENKPPPKPLECPTGAFRTIGRYFVRFGEFLQGGAF